MGHSTMVYSTLVLTLVLLTCTTSYSSWYSHLVNIDVDGAIERFINAATEYYNVGGVEALTRAFQIDEGTVFVNRTLVFGLEDALASQYNVGCFRIPAVVQTTAGVILAFAEGRLDGCNDCAKLGIAMKRSLDGGQTWSNLSWPVPPIPTGEGYAMDTGGNPTVVYDSIRDQVVLHFNRGMTDPDNDGKYDCIPAVDNFQITSPDAGLSWSEVRNISSFLGEYRGLLPGPGTGTFLPSTGRILFAGHFLTSYRDGGAVVVYYSDDGGETYQLSNSTFPKADESSLAAVDESHLVVNHRLSVDECEVCKHGCNCRGRAFSNDSGLTWTQMELDPELTDPVCEGSINTIGNYTAFSNPPMSFARANMSIALSLTGGHDWTYRLQVTDEYQYTDYSSLVGGQLLREVEEFEHPVAGLLWGSCEHPIPMRVWCLYPTSWNIYFSRIELDPDTFVTINP